MSTINQNMDYNWKKRIKYLQILSFVFLLIWYFAWWWMMEKKTSYEELKKQLNQKITKIANVKSQIVETENLISNIEDIHKNFKSFSDAFSDCYWYYQKKGYSLYTWLVSLRDCIYEHGYKKPYIKNMEDEKIVKIAKSFWIIKLDNKKLDFPETKILYSLDKNIFSDNLESRVDFVTFWTPTLVNKKYNLYSVNFSFKTHVNYTMFKNLFKKLQTNVFNKNYIFYDINSVSPFDVTDKSMQDLLVNWKIYFQK